MNKKNLIKKVPKEPYMLLTLITQESINTSFLPQEIAGMHWIERSGEAKDCRLGFVEAQEGAWVLYPKSGNMLFDSQGTTLEKAHLDLHTEKAFGLKDAESSATLIARPACKGDTSYQVVGYTQDQRLSLGSASDNVYVYPSPFVSTYHACIDFIREEFTLTDLNSSYGTFVNGSRITPNTKHLLAFGDVVEILGLRLCVGNRFLSMNNPGDSLAVLSRKDFVYLKPQSYTPPRPKTKDTKEPSFFYPAPRFKRDVECKVFSVDAPPAPEKLDETPLAMKIGPSMIMAFAAVFSGMMMFTTIVDSGGNIMRGIPMLVMALSMLLGAVLWPVLSRLHQNKKTLRMEVKRKATYGAYLDKIRLLIQKEMILQKEILEENRITVFECARRAFEKDAHLMDRTNTHDDFMELRLGRGTVSLSADIRYPDEHFAIEEDELAKVVYALSKEPTDMRSCPVSVALSTNQVLGIAGNTHKTSEFTYGLITQIATLHTFEDVKIVLLLEKSQIKTWQWAFFLPHVFDDTQNTRFVASTLEEAQEIGLYLERIVDERTNLAKGDVSNITPHYVIIVPSKEMATKVEFIGHIAKKRTPGFSLITLATTPQALLKQCTSIVEITDESASLRTQADITGTSQIFSPDIFVTEAEARSLALALNKVDLDLRQGKGALPENLGFMEMYEAGNVEQLNVRTRWAEKKASATLAAPVGVDANKEPFILNLHEKFHGPHGLIAGTTGSGKSECIISWILSMCVNYSPVEVAFVLIDYKGGGLAGAFDNERVRLPHLAGTITNLDGAAINRSLVSIKSELKRRQALFNEARERAGGDNVDIYKYLELYHEGKVGQMCPHLFIVADEFAELKQQEPEFMDELISAARIGRSLGVHLVLATQKPSGVVNDQIWSNSKFKLCLKVADKEDSKEMIKRPDAAEITQAGRFFLLVGYNEYFASGQSAYTGTPYRAREQYLAPRDDAVVLIAATGRPLLSLKPARNTPLKKPSPELVAILLHIKEVAASEGVAAHKLWLDPIPAHITVDELRRKYADTLAARDANPFVLDPIIGELDDPENQAQHLLTLPLTREGNALIYGSAGSGVETILASMLYSLLQDHRPDTLNIYIMDFGAETLGVFSNAPQVGDVVFASDEEKVERLFTFLEKEITARKKELASHGGFVEYCKKTASPRPPLLILMNDVAAFYEIYEGLESPFVSLTRDGNRVGMYFIVTATSMNSIRMKLRANFTQVFITQFNDDNDYTSVLGSMRGVVAPKSYAKGLVKLENTIYEFQGAKVEDFGENGYEVLQSFVAEQGRTAASSARKIPILPSMLHVKDLLSFETTEGELPFGMLEEDLTPACFNTHERAIGRILYSKPAQAQSFLQAYINYLKELEGVIEFEVLDVAGFFDEEPALRCLREEADISTYFDKLIATRNIPRTTQLVVVFIGASLFLSRTSPDITRPITRYFRTLKGKEKTGIILVDSATAAAGYVQEDWFKEQTSVKDALWIGEGMSSQASLMLEYSSKPIESRLKPDRGYIVESGLYSLVKLVSSKREE